MEDVIYDLIVIGGGPAGYNGAEYAAKNGMKVALIEKADLGGVCLNSGCIPSKTFLNSAKMLSHAVNGDKYAVILDGTAHINQSALVARKNKVARILGAGIKQKLKSNGVEVIKGSAYIEKCRDELFCVKVGESTLTAKKLLIATGSQAFIPPIPGIHASLESGFAVTNAEVFDLTTVPECLTVIGGGVIGVELATYFASAGSAVTILESGERILPQIDSDIAEVLVKRLVKKGITIVTGARVIKMGDGTVIYRKNGEDVSVTANKVLVAAGRRPNAINLGLENINLEYVGGKIATDSKLRTAVPGVYAAGDVNGVSALAHTAYREAEVAVNDMLGRNDGIRYDTVPSVVYTDPEIASVGLTQDRAEADGIPTKVIKLPLSYSGRYVAENDERDGFAKLILDGNGKKLLGFSAIGPYSGEYVTIATAFIDLETDVERIKKIIFPHPTVAEIIREGLHYDV